MPSMETAKDFLSETCQRQQPQKKKTSTSYPAIEESEGSLNEEKLFGNQHFQVPWYFVDLYLIVGLLDYF